MGKPDAPTPPDPFATAQAATGTNVSTAVANAYLGHVNQNTPDGSLQYNTTGNYGWTDPVSGQTYQIPTFTATQSLSPQGQAIKDQTLAAQYNLAGMANAQSGRVSNLLSTPFDPSGTAPAGGNASTIGAVPGAATSFNPGGPVQTSLDTSGLANQSNMLGSYGPSQGQLTDFINQTQQAMLGQIQPQLDIQKNQLQQQLADQGIRYGSDAYNNAFTPFNQQENNAYLQTVTGATGQANTLLGMAGQQAAFQNAAQQQAYQQALGAGSFANQAQGQQFGQNAQQATFQNAGLAQQVAQAQSAFNAAQAQRNQSMQEQYAQRNQPLNEITSLLSGSQVSQPNFINAPQSQIPTTDIAGLINTNFNQQQANYAQQNQNYQSLMGGILGLGAGALKGGYISDKRVKNVGDKIATIFAAGDDGEPKKLPIYEWAYKADPSTRHTGPMAQDVEKITPSAVGERGGVKYIKPDQVMGSILRAA